MSARTYHADDPDRVTPGASVACPACGATSSACYRCEECEADLVGESEELARRIRGSR